MRFVSIFLFLLPSVLMADNRPCLSDDLSPYWTVGVARGAQGQVLYCEFHWKSEDGTQGRVIYKNPQGKTIVEKDLIWRADAARPHVKQFDLRSGELIEVQGGDSWLLRYQKKHAAPSEEVRLSDNQVGVVDAGFDHKIRQHWDALLRGEKRVVNFAAPALQRSVALRILREDASRCAHAGDSDNHCFWVEANNGLVRMFVDPLRLSYDAERRLRVYEGVVNVRDDAGKKQTATIVYQYPGEW